MHGRFWSGWGSICAASALAACQPTTPDVESGDTTEASTSGDTGMASTASLDGSDASTSGDATTTADTTTADATDTGEPSACVVAAVPGDCEPVTDCPRGSTPFQALCEGPPVEQCCVPASPPCSVDGAPGLCLPTADCPAPLVATPDLCPGAADIQCCTDPETACDPTAMPTPNEGLTEDPGDPGCPAGMAMAGTVCIDRHEAALLDLDDAGRVLGHHSPYFNPGTARVRAVSLAGAIPQGYISQLQAADACAEAGKRLCTDDEWLRACQGAATTTYPWGDTPQPGRCNDARVPHPAVEYFGTSEPWVFSELDHPCISQIPASLHVTGRHPDCISEDGALDMVGNLHEWTADPAGTFRGGFFVDTVINGPGCQYLTTAHDVSYWDYSTGFRCCADPA